MGGIPCTYAVNCIIIVVFADIGTNRFTSYYQKKENEGKTK